MIEDALTAPTTNEVRELLKFYLELGLIEGNDSMKAKIYNPNFNVPRKPIKLTSESIENTKNILLIDNIKRHYRRKKGLSNADDICEKICDKVEYANRIYSMVIDESWDKRKRELANLINGLHPSLIVMHLNSFLHEQGYNRDKVNKIYKQHLIPLLTNVINSNDKTKILLYSRRSILENAFPFKDILDLGEGRIEFIPIDADEDKKENFLNDDIIKSLESRMDNMIK